MADTVESSSSSSMNGKPVLVRVKRKASQTCLDAFWLEINERPPKRRLLDLGKLSISDSAEKEEAKIKKILVQRVDTVSSSEATLGILQSLRPNSTNASEVGTKVEERKYTFKRDNKQDQLLSRARENHEVLAKNARFEQIWKSRKGNKQSMHDDSIHEICHLYDVVRVDVEEETVKKVEKLEDTSFEDNTILFNYLPLMREFLPSAAAEIEADMHAYMSKQASTDDYVYDLYAVKDSLETMDEDALNTYPLVQVDDDDYYDGPSQSELESDDSNAEDNPLNDYPDEETSDDDEDESSSNDESEELRSESVDDQSEQQEDKIYYNYSEDADSMYEEDMYIDDEEEEDDDDWRLECH